jgi:hypothetical protein
VAGRFYRKNNYRWKRNPPSIRINIPTEYTYVNSFSTNSRKENDRKREKLMNGFKTEDFLEIIKREMKI